MRKTKVEPSSETKSVVSMMGQDSKKETTKSARKTAVRNVRQAIQKTAANVPLKEKPSKASNAAKKISESGTEGKGLKKTYLKSAFCKVTFRLPKEAAPKANKVTIVGDFNRWNYNESEMKKLKNGDFELTMKLSCNREYRFRYLIDSSTWENDWCADKYIRNPFGGDDSVVVV